FTRADGSTGGYVEVALETAFGFLSGDDDDVIIGDPGSSDTLTGTDGADTFVLTDLEAADIIADFNIEEGDSVDLTGLFQVPDGGEVGDYASYDASSGTLTVDADGAGGADAVVVATFNNPPPALTIIFDDSTDTPSSTII